MAELLGFLGLDDNRKLWYTYTMRDGIEILGYTPNSAPEEEKDAVYAGYRLLLSYIGSWPEVRLENDGTPWNNICFANNSDSLTLLPNDINSVSKNTGYELYISGSRLYLFLIEDSYGRSDEAAAHGYEVFVASFSFADGFTPDLEVIRRMR